MTAALHSFDAALCAALAAALADLDQGQGGTFALPRPVDAQGTRFWHLADAMSLEPGQAALVGLLWAEQRIDGVADALEPFGGVTEGFARALIAGAGPGMLAPRGALRLFDLVAADRPFGPAARLSLDPALAERLSGEGPRIALLEARLTRVMPGGSAPGLAQRLRGLMVRPDGAPVVLAEAMALPVIATIVGELGFGLRLIRAGRIPDDPEARDRFARLWSREALFDSLMLVIEPQAGHEAAAVDLAERVVGHVLLTAPLIGLQRPLAVLSGDALAADPTGPWRAALGEDLARQIGAPMLWRLARSFRLEPSELAALGAQVRGFAGVGAEQDASLADLVWRRAARAHAVMPLPGVLMQEPVYAWRDLVLPPALMQALRGLEAHVRQSSKVFDLWGFDRVMGGRGRGVAALFAGPSGAGKTMAAEVLAEALGLRMMVIDLSQIISKYIGETAKNVAAAFAEAERCGAVMVWNEGDAIWGARGQVGHATDRHVNAETGDLLARIEAFQGVTVVTTNLRHAIDPAFLRRFRLVLDFPLPGVTERQALWQRAFPVQAPLDKIDLSVLADLPLSGGAIRNVALTAAVLAAEAGSAIGTSALAAAIRSELAKTSQPMPQIDWGPT